MKFLIGIISGIALAGAGIAVTSSGSPSTAAAETLTPQVALTPETQTTSTRPATKQVRLFTGELERKDVGFELKLTLLQNGERVDRDVRVLVSNARVTNGAGRLVRLPLDEADARISGVMLPRSAWRLDDEGRAIPTLTAKRIIIAPNENAGEGGKSAQDASEVHTADAD
ncbi:MAG: hypothetical protein QOK36_4323 [Gaiellales bacterium]|jgi:hypothetical protein|nr:hypothetical protein [Gaiellales bacterium]